MKTSFLHLRLRRNLGPNASEGQRLLWVALAERKWSFADLARALRMDRSSANRWLYGDRLPDITSASMIERLFGIRASLWAEKPTKSILPAMSSAQSAMVDAAEARTASKPQHKRRIRARLPTLVAIRPEDIRPRRAGTNAR